MAKRDWRGTESREKKSHWEGSWKHRACGFPLSTATFTWSDFLTFSLCLSLSCSLFLLFSCSLSEETVTAGCTYRFCGNACVSLSLDVCFAPVLVVLLLGCGKIINMGCRLGGGGVCDSLTPGHCLFAWLCGNKRSAAICSANDLILHSLEDVQTSVNSCIIALGHLSQMKWTIVGSRE